MPFYYNIDSTTRAGRRSATRLLALRDAIETTDNVPARTLNDTLLLATWNIREFGAGKYGGRLDESFYYIAEIISHFDLVALQEVREDLRALDKVQRILGHNWNYVVTDVTEGRPGNRERLAYLYDSRKVKFGGVAGEIVIPAKAIRRGRRTIRYDPADQLYRTPYLVGFRAGWFDFMLCTVHILYGKDKPNNPKRIKEIQLIADFLSERADEDTSWSRNIILLGDFNIYSRQDKTFKALTDAGFIVPPALQQVPVTNIGKKKRCYDQIAFKVRPNRLQVLSANVFDFYNVVFTNDDERTYASRMGKSYRVANIGKPNEQPRSDRSKSTYYRSKWRTFQMSDHLLMWVELGIDFGKEYLSAKSGTP